MIEKGYDVLEVREKDQTMTDEEVLEWASSENRIVITIDKDFGELFVVNSDVDCSIIRLPDMSFEKRAQLIEIVISKYEKQLLSRVMITVSKNKIRVRKI